MTITTFAPSTVFLPSAQAADVIASAPPKPAVSSATPVVINSIGSGTGPGTTSSDVQSRINSINGLVQSAENIIWSAGDPGITPEQIAQAQSTEAQHLLAGEGATIAFADQSGLQGISLNFLPIDFPAPTSGSPSSSTLVAESQAAAGASHSVADAAPVSAVPPGSTDLAAVSSQRPVNAQTSSLVTSGGAASVSTSAADIGLSVLVASGQNPASQTATTLGSNQTYDIYA